MKTIRRNATRQFAALKASHTVAVVKAKFSNYEAVTCQPVDAWNHFEGERRAQAWLKTDGTLVLSIHSSRWYELREPVAAS